MARPRIQPVSPLPYLAVAGTYGLLVWTVLHPWTDPVSGLAFGALLVTALLVARQLLAVRENVRLLTETAARQNEARFRSLVQHSSDVIIVIRPNGQMRFVSPSATRVLGYDPSELVGRQIGAVLHPEDTDRSTTFLAEAVTGARRHGSGRAALPAAGRLLAPHRDPRHQPAARLDRARASCSTPAT